MIKKVKTNQKIASLSARKRVSNKFRIIDIWRNEVDEKEFLIKLKNAQVIFSLIEVIVFASLAQKIFLKILFDEDLSNFMSISSDFDRLRKKKRNNDMSVNLLKQRSSLKTSSESLNWWIQRRKLMWWSEDWWTRRE
jgi:hypothetical protein